MSLSFTLPSGSALLIDDNRIEFEAMLTANLICSEYVNAVVHFSLILVPKLICFHS